MLSYENAVKVLSRYWWCLSGLNIMAILMFSGTFDYIERIDIFLTAIVVSAMIGLVHGLYIMFRAKFTSFLSIVMLMYMIIQLEIFVLGSTSRLFCFRER